MVQTLLPCHPHRLAVMTWKCFVSITQRHSGRREKENGKIYPGRMTVESTNRFFDSVLLFALKGFLLRSRPQETSRVSDVVDEQQFVHKRFETRRRKH